jgi:hypothetical protein
MAKTGDVTKQASIPRFDFVLPRRTLAIGDGRVTR